MSRTARSTSVATGPTAPSEFVTFRLAEQWFGIPVLAVQEVLMEQRIARVPLAPPAVAGFLNLRGQIVTAVDLRTTLRLAPREPTHEVMNVVVRHDGELFAFLVDDVGDVVSVAHHAIEPTPPTLDPRWASAASGIVRRDVGLLLVIDVQDLLRLEHTAA